MKEIIKHKAFYWVSIFASAIVFVALLNFNQVYEAKTVILVIPRGQMASNGDQMVENIKNIPYTLLFYKKIVSENPDLADDAILELSDQKKKEYWNSKINIERKQQSGILEISVTDKSRYRAESFSIQIARNLIKGVGLLYDIRNDIDVRLIEEASAETSTSKPFYEILLNSLAVGFILSFLSFLFSFSIFQNKRMKKSFDANYFTDKKTGVIKKEKAEMPWFSMNKEKDRLIKKATAPDNLPVAQISLSKGDVFSENKETESDNEKSESVAVAPIIREATPEEVKERLNRLLSGKL